jgi:DNA invertase Pin-like site-specific DNA recombinase
MGAFAEFERNIIRKRQAEGIAKAKDRGVYMGRTKKVDGAKIIDLKQKGQKVSEIAVAMRVSRMTVYRALASHARVTSPNSKTV